MIKHFDESIPNHPIYKKRVEGVFRFMIQIKVNKTREFSFIQQFVQSLYLGKKYIQQMDLILKTFLMFFEMGKRYSTR
jgi:hypothetical protein